MALITCPECGQKVSETAITCPSCGVKISNGHTKKANRKLIIFLLIFAVCCVIGMMILAYSTSSQSSTNQELNINTGYATLEKFNQIETGMKYEDVVKIMGSEGTVMSESEVLDIKTTLYYWYARNGVSNMNIMVQDGEVISKAQIGLD